MSEQGSEDLAKTRRGFGESGPLGQREARLPVADIGEILRSVQAAARLQDLIDQFPDLSAGAFPVGDQLVPVVEGKDLDARLTPLGTMSHEARLRIDDQMIGGIVLVALGVYFLVRDQLTIDWGVVWAAGLVALGVVVVAAAFLPRR